MTHLIPSITYLSYISAAYRVGKDGIYDFVFAKENTTTDERIYSSCGLYNTYTTFFSEPTHIIDNIYLGSAYNAANYTQLKDKGIEIIINMTSEIDEYFPNDFIYKKFPLRDNGIDDVGVYLNEIIGYVKENKNKNILIHCKMGASRSAIAVVYYLMIHHKMTLDNALEFTKEKRLIINPNNKFIDTLKDFSNNL